MQHGARRATHVLLAGDDPEMLLVMRWALEDEGFAVQTVGDGTEALDRSAELRPALVVLDVPLRHLEAEKLVAQLRDLYGEVPLLVTAMEGAAEYARRAGAFDYLSKPFDLRDFLARVRNGLARAQERMRA